MNNWLDELERKDPAYPDIPADSFCPCGNGGGEVWSLHCSCGTIHNYCTQCGHPIDSRCIL